MRLAVVGLSLEANTFSSVHATIEGMRNRGDIHLGQQITEHYAGSTSTLAGFLDPDVPDGVELVPLVSFRAGAMGTFTADTFAETTREICRSLAGESWDGVLLGLHGAAVAEDVEHADAEIAVRVRATVGPDVPIGVVLDMHANVDQQLVDAVDVLRIYQTNPHIDASRQALECRAGVIAIASGQPRPATVLERLPLVVNILRQGTQDEPMAEILARCAKWESEEGMLDVSVAEGFPYADVEQMGMAVVASHHDDETVARAAAADVAAAIWAARDHLQDSAPSVDDALAAVCVHTGPGPILLLDVGDNVGGGSCGDSTVLLQAAQEQGVGGIAFTLWDPACVRALADQEIGARVTATVGGRSAEQDGTPQTVEAVITGRSDGEFTDSGPTHGGFSRFNVGPTVALRTSIGNAVVVTTHPQGNTSAELLRMVGVEPTEFTAIVGKGVHSPKAGYGRICPTMLMVDTPGVTRASIDQFSYRRRPRPMYPFEPETTYPPHH
ncbi:M81 family metallopeptidase [Nakamurella lactea]|uniref:M81 family metallopeptidase n=1 Tax=Nakamurella lactea TaxID=459515 RepID=UPI00048C3EEE|nr:M81 family metallopeptidase [Nakamurella lactea]